MVSLERQANFPSSSTVVDPEFSSGRDDRQNLLHSINGERIHRSGYINTHFLASLFLFLSVTVGVVVTVLAVIWRYSDYRECESYFFIVYIQVIYWAYSLFYDVYIRRKHTDLRIEGFLEFYKKSTACSRLPFHLTTIWNTLILICSAVFHQLYGEMKEHCTGHLLDPLHYVSAFVLLEVTMVSIVLAFYIILVTGTIISGQSNIMVDLLQTCNPRHKQATTYYGVVKIEKIMTFNKSKTCADALREEWMASFIRESYSNGEVGYRESENYVTDLLEKQADLLRYLKEQNSRLVQKVMILSLQLKENRGASIT